MAKPALELVEGGARLFVRASPRASRNAVQGIAPGADERMQVKVAVTAVPEDGKANAAIIKILAKEWRIAKSSIDIVAGGTDRSKVLFVAGERAVLEPLLTTWLAGL
ncbi:DUF167 domain-containing protein [Niveispirillum irakense]|uniref:DUF167 domain-containing protein n=1 Tax=Niveispirillum irakense TaxID=34011 RepID=UPI00041528BB|nr:DUF167 domain-containing protein [Niveispirillum irakense]